ncbi:MAG: hypothetical protein ACUVQ0_06490 [Thermoproteota archaeon]
MKLQLFEDCDLDSDRPDWELVDKYLEHWSQVAGDEEVSVTFFKRDDKGYIVTDKERLTEAGPLFFKHCSAECVEWIYAIELKPVDYTPESLAELDRVLDTY